VRRIVKIPVDYRIDVDAVRRKVEEIVADDPRSTGEPPEVEMVEVNADTAVLWVWISGTNAFTSWYLHNEVRERVVGFLKELEGGAYLPRRRHILLSEAEDEGVRTSSRRRRTAGRVFPDCHPPARRRRDRGTQSSPPAPVNTGWPGQSPDQVRGGPCHFESVFTPRRCAQRLQAGGVAHLAPRAASALP
jgi:hypothetical protein